MVRGSRLAARRGSAHGRNVVRREHLIRNKSLPACRASPVAGLICWRIGASSSSLHEDSVLEFASPAVRGSRLAATSSEYSRQRGARRAPHHEGAGVCGSGARQSRSPPRSNRDANSSALMVRCSPRTAPTQMLQLGAASLEPRTLGEALLQDVCFHAATRKKHWSPIQRPPRLGRSQSRAGEPRRSREVRTAKHAYAYTGVGIPS